MLLAGRRSVKVPQVVAAVAVTVVVVGLNFREVSATLLRSRLLGKAPSETAPEAAAVTVEEVEVVEGGAPHQKAVVVACCGR
jgi:hypothetical protein